MSQAAGAAPQQPRRSRWQWLRDAFSTESEYGPLTDEDDALLDRIAAQVVRRRLTAPAVLLLESVRPLNYVGSQAMAFFQPMVRLLFTGADYTRLQQILDRRESLERLVQRIELAESQARPPRDAMPSAPDPSQGSEGR